MSEKEEDWRISLCKIEDEVERIRRAKVSPLKCKGDPYMISAQEIRSYEVQRAELVSKCLRSIEQQRKRENKLRIRFSNKNTSSESEQVPHAEVKEQERRSDKL